MESILKCDNGHRIHIGRYYHVIADDKKCTSCDRVYYSWLYRMFISGVPHAMHMSVYLAQEALG